MQITKPKAIIASAMMALPMSGCYNAKNIPSRKIATAEIQKSAKLVTDTLEKTSSQKSPLTRGLPSTYIPNKDGNRIESFEDNALCALKNKLSAQKSPVQYSAPIDNSYRPYVSAKDGFGTANGILPRLGINISIPTPDSTKPVAVLAPIDGIIVKQSIPNKQAGIRQTQIMGNDGKMYSFEYLATLKDYAKAKLPIFQKIGTSVKAKDTLGLIAGSNSAEALKLHLEVNDLDQQLKQLNNNTWKSLSACFGIKPKGQVNPLDPSKAGGISGVLSQYKIEKGQQLPIMKELD